MKEKYKELKEDILDEARAIEQTLERLYKIRTQFDSNIKDYTTEPAMGTYLMNFYNVVENFLKLISAERLYPYLNFRHSFISGYGFH